MEVSRKGQAMKDHFMDSTKIMVDDSGLQPVNSAPNMREYLTRLHKRRYFINADARSRALSNGRGMFLGRAWLVLQPLLEILVYALIFGVILKVSRGIENYVGYLIIGVVFFRFVSRGINSGSGLIQSNHSLISSFNFPRAAVACSAIKRQLYDNIIPAIVALVTAFSLQESFKISWTLILIVPIFLLLHLFLLGIVFIIARLTAFVPDIKSLVSLLNRALFFTSGIFYSLDRFEGHPVLLEVMKFNPVYQYLTAARDVSIYARVPELYTTLNIVFSTVLVLLVGFVFFWRAEERYTGVK